MSLRRQQQGHRTIQTSPAVSQTQRTLMLLLLLLLSLPLALPVYLSLRLALPQDHRAGRRGREPGYQRGTQICREPSSRPCRGKMLCLPLPRSLGMSTLSWA
ncbi:unnamed protein product [Arctogadus glacialis]